MENWFRLTAESLLLSVISSFTLSKIGCLAGFVLRNFVLGVLAALLAVGSLFLGCVDHDKYLMRLEGRYFLKDEILTTTMF